MPKRAWVSANEAAGDPTRKSQFSASSNPPEGRRGGGEGGGVKRRTALVVCKPKLKLNSGPLLDGASPSLSVWVARRCYCIVLLLLDRVEDGGRTGDGMAVDGADDGAQAGLLGGGGASPGGMRSRVLGPPPPLTRRGRGGGAFDPGDIHGHALTLGTGYCPSGRRDPRRC